MDKIRLLANLTMGYLISVNVVMLITFFYAYIQPTKVILLSVNSIGEGLIEAVFLILFNILNIFGIVIISKILRKKEVFNAI